MSFTKYISVVVTGFPRQLKQPTPLPGERLLQVAIRTNPQRWKACVEELAAAHSLASVERKRLLSGDLATLTPAMQSQVESWGNTALPVHFRTLEGLSRLRSSLRDKPNNDHAIIDILWLRELPPEDNAEGKRKLEEAKAMAEKLGVKIAFFPHGSSSPSPTGSRITEEELWMCGIDPPPATLDLTEIVRQTATGTQFIWLLPGGTRLPDNIGRLMREALVVIAGFDNKVLYTDNVSSFIVQKSPLYDLINRRVPVAADPAWLGRVFQKEGKDVYIEKDVNRTLCDLESEFGGWTKPTPEAVSWWKRLFGG